MMPAEHMPLPPGLKTEKAWQTLVIGYAQTKGWRVAHFRAARVREGKWVTAVQGNAGAGFPDLVLIKDRVLFRELKGDKTTVEKHQVEVMAALKAAGADVAIWRPKDWPEVQEELSRRGAFSIDPAVRIVVESHLANFDGSLIDCSASQLARSVSRLRELVA